MPTRRLLVIGLLLGLCVRPHTTFAEVGRYTAQLEAECDAMLQSAVRRPYGWAWDPLVANSDPARPRAVSMEPAGTPAIGLLLLLSGELLKKPTYLDAAVQAGRGIAAAREENGRVAPVPIFGPSVTIIPDTSALPDRASSRAGLAFALLTRDRARPDSELDSGLSAIARWLVLQPAASGAWPTASSEFTDDGKPLRVVRLDNPDYRDCTFALLLAGEALHDQSLTASGERALAAVLEMRLADRNKLWMISYDLKLSANAQALRLPSDVDLLASRAAMQTLLGGYLMTGDRKLGRALDESVQAAMALRKKDGRWDRFPESTQPNSAMQSTAGSLPGEAINLDPLSQSIRQLKVLGRDKYRRMLERHFSLPEQLALAACGISDAPLLLDLPVMSEETGEYLKRHEEDSKALEGDAPAELPGRVRRLWLLLVRAKIERM